MGRRTGLILMWMVGALLPAVAGFTEATDDFSEAFIQAAEEVRPSVVTIRVTRKVKALTEFRFSWPPGKEPLPLPQLPEELRRFFRRGLPPSEEPDTDPSPPTPGKPPRFRGRGPFKRPHRGVGSGIIYDRKGHIVTNHHVVKGAEKIEVIFHDGETVEARVVAADPKSDIAVIKVETDHPLKPARFADSDSLRIGQWVLAVGSPFGLTQSVSAGIISGLGRNVGAIRGQFTYEHFIQTDADINQGSSGGPLVNLDGEVVGLCIAIASENNLGFTPYPGTGFAIPANRVREVAQALIERGKVIRGYLGVALRVLERAEARRRGLKVKEAVVVDDVLPGSPAERAGMRAGDVIIRYRGEEVTDLDEFRFRVARTAPGTEAEVVVLRGDEEVTLTVTVGEQPEPVSVAAGSVPGEFGLQLQTLTEDLAQQMGYGGLHGALITEVQPGSPADSADLEPGDLILEVAKKPVTSAEECASALAEAGDTVLIRVKKPSGETLYKTLKKD